MRRGHSQTYQLDAVLRTDTPWTHLGKPFFRGPFFSFPKFCGQFIHSHNERRLLLSPEGKAEGWSLLSILQPGLVNKTGEALEFVLLGCNPTLGKKALLCMSSSQGLNSPLDRKSRALEKGGFLLSLGIPKPMRLLQKVPSICEQIHGPSVVCLGSINSVIIILELHLVSPKELLGPISHWK